MRIPRMRFTLRRMMIVVGLIAVALGVGIGGARCWMSLSYWQRARSYAGMADYWQWQAGRIHELYPGQDEAEIRGKLGEAIRWNRRMEDKYRRAASRPWEAVPPDPQPWEAVPPDPPWP